MDFFCFNPGDVCLGLIIAHTLGFIQLINALFLKGERLESQQRHTAQGATADSDEGIFLGSGTITEGSFSLWIISVNDVFNFHWQRKQIDGTLVLIFSLICLA